MVSDDEEVTETTEITDWNEGDICPQCSGMIFSHQEADTGYNSMRCQDCGLDVTDLDKGGGE